MSSRSTTSAAKRTRPYSPEVAAGAQAASHEDDDDEGHTGSSGNGKSRSYAGVGAQEGLQMSASRGSSMSGSSRGTTTGGSPSSGKGSGTTASSGALPAPAATPLLPYTAIGSDLAPSLSQFSDQWFGIWSASLGAATSMQVNLWKMGCDQFNAMLGTLHKTLLGMALPDPLTDRSLWWAMENFPATLEPGSLEAVTRDA